MIPTDFKYVLDVQNTKNTMLDVTTKDIKVIDTKTNKEDNVEISFHLIQLQVITFLLLT